MTTEQATCAKSQVGVFIWKFKEKTMATKPTHFKYVCRICQKEHLQPVLQDAPEKTPIPRCCGRDRDMAYTGVHHEPQDQRKQP